MSKNVRDVSRVGWGDRIGQSSRYTETGEGRAGLRAVRNLLHALRYRAVATGEDDIELPRDRRTHHALA